jgi:hypothetical protein
VHPLLSRDTDLLDRGRRRGPRSLWYFWLWRASRSGRDNTSTMNSAARGRRLASPVRLTLAFDLGGDLDGAWWPHTASVARELPELTDALFRRLGRIIDISVNWSSLTGPPDHDSLHRPNTADPGRMISRQRLMTITGREAAATLLVVPSRTASVLAAVVLRRAAGLPITAVERNTQAFQTADEIVRAARAESSRCAQRLKQSDPHSLTSQIQL